MPKAIFSPKLRGSSPHTRGAPARLPGSARLRRIIPAYAGSTGRHLGPAPSESDHPRIRGEHKPPLQTQVQLQGSSPHTRGAPVCGENLEIGNRIIPAYAGSTAKSMSFREVGTRIIPAYAGSTRRPAGKSHGPEDHPRIRGEHVDRYGVTCPIARIIPAYAGSTPPPSSAPPSPADHPRIRGEHRLSGLYTGDGQGSSPHTRGAPPCTGGDACAAGIIPAYAGSTASLRFDPC